MANEPQENLPNNKKSHVRCLGKQKYFAANNTFSIYVAKI